MFVDHSIFNNFKYFVLFINITSTKYSATSESNLTGIDLYHFYFYMIIIDRCDIYETHHNKCNRFQISGYSHIYFGHNNV